VLWFVPNLLWGINARLNSTVAFMFGKKKGKYKREREVFVGADNGNFSVDWYKVGEKDLPENAPIVMFIHGINGGSGEPTIETLALLLMKKFGYRCCCCLFRFRSFIYYYLIYQRLLWNFNHHC
jgi:predicted alpha/beta-fold hydrolase